MELGTLNVILHGLKTRALIFTLADMLGEATEKLLTHWVMWSLRQFYTPCLTLKEM